MKLTIDGREQDVELSFTSTEYNCSVKLVGRLMVNMAGKPQGYVDGTLHNHLMDAKVKDALIRELSDKMGRTSTYPTLKSTSLYFPTDSGTYLPNYLIYADSIAIYTDTPWYTSFKALIREFQNNPHHRFRVFELPMYSNNTYSSSIHPSKVWGIVPPGMVNRLLIPDNKLDSRVQEACKYISYKEAGWPEQDAKVIKGFVS